MGKCLSCCKQDQNFQPYENQVTSDLWHHGASSVSQSSRYLGRKTSHPSVTHKASLPRGRKRLWLPSSSSFSERRCFLFFRVQKSNSSIYRQQSRANFDSQEDLSCVDVKSSSDHFGVFRSQRRFSSHKLSVVSCYKSTICFDPQSNSQNMFNVNEIELFCRNQSNTDAEKHISLSAPRYTTEHFKNFETRAASSAHVQNTVDGISNQQNIASFFPLATVVASPHQQNGIATDVQQRGQISKDLKDSLHCGSQNHSTRYSPAMIQQHPCQHVTSPILHHAGFSSSPKNAGSFSPPQNEVTLGLFEEENSSQNEGISSPVEIPLIRYITANTDTEERNFPISKAFNAHVEELKLDVLLQKADHLRMDESGKLESFELLCDHKEKFRDEIEFMWRLARAYGDMYELSTNTQEKKYYANIGLWDSFSIAVQFADHVQNGILEKRFINFKTFLELFDFDVDDDHDSGRYAVLCGYVSEFEGLQNKVNYGHLFKEHLDKAIQLLPEESFLYYLKGRYCYTVSKLSWIEKKMAATLFGKIPSSTVQEALQNFLKAEELYPGYSNPNYLYLAKCYIDIEEKQNALKFCNLALLLPCVTKEDKEAQQEIKKIIASLKR
ncbi:PREDICTED: regulator of microtubule dynamics protein 2 [Propithecus coquereli]|uniref:regulator of microtubule dynamics protein 2 n=1 Tax=Propithecus coquereli TaxID=379532 RepID=UPI00063FAB4F|nr:PREDICTED: regulator of microtubule dynamics protein 2 [Propithecus coquereli]